MFLGITEDVVSSDPLVLLDRVVLTALQKLCTDLVDKVMIAVTEIGSAIVAIAVIAAVSVALAHKRCWRALAYWLTAAGFAQATVWTLKMTEQRGRPLAMYDGVTGSHLRAGTRPRASFSNR